MIVHLDKGCDIIERQLGFVDVSSDRTANAISTVSIHFSVTKTLLKHSKISSILQELHLKKN